MVGGGGAAMSRFASGSNSPVSQRMSPVDATLPTAEKGQLFARGSHASDVADAIRDGLPDQENRLRHAEEECRRWQQEVKRATQKAEEAERERQSVLDEVEHAKNHLSMQAAEYLRSLLRSDGAFGIDIGGTACKITYISGGARDSFANSSLFERQFWGCTGRRLVELEFDHQRGGGTVHFVRFATHRVNPVLTLLKEERVRSDDPHNVGTQRTVFATGGGAFKFEELSREAVNVSYAKVGEFDSLVEGFRFALRACPWSVYSIDAAGKQCPSHVDPEGPFLLCNIGSGVSVILVEADSAVRVGGTSIGGSSFLGLSRLAAGAMSFDDAVRLAAEGDANEVDLTVRDIYGKMGEHHLGLPGNTVACSFGKLVAKEKPQEASGKDVAASLLKMVTQAISLYTCSLAKLYNCKGVFFTGGFLRQEKNKSGDGSIAEIRFSEACNLSQFPAHFLHHAEYLGALGCLNRSLDQTGPARTRSPCVVPIAPARAVPPVAGALHNDSFGRDSAGGDKDMVRSPSRVRPIADLSGRRTPPVDCPPSPSSGTATPKRECTVSPPGSVRHPPDAPTSESGNVVIDTPMSPYAATPDLQGFLAALDERLSKQGVGSGEAAARAVEGRMDALERRLEEGNRALRLSMAMLLVCVLLGVIVGWKVAHWGQQEACPAV
eukprot:Hpha_TRINITY_DN3620_c0_g1::TRINITY_DN3620_c0_g1_i1::g.867::m.867/K09680/coaW; type II pantothenate kinase